MLNRVDFVDFLDITEDRTEVGRIRDRAFGRLVMDFKRAADIEVLRSCVGVEDLELWGWPEVDFSVIRHLAPRCLRLVRGRQTSLTGLDFRRLRKLWLQGPMRLATLQRVKASWLAVDACNTLNLASMASVAGLRCVDLASQKVLDSLAFVAGCRQLQALSLACHAFRVTDLKPIIRSPSLRLVYCNRLSQQQVEKIARDNPRLFVANETFAMYMARPAAVDDYESRLARFLSKHKLTEYE